MGARVNEDLILFYNLIMSGILTGCFYALIGMSLVLIYKTSKVLNLCQGELTLLGGYVCFSILMLTGLPFLVAFFLSLFCLFFLGMLIERSILRSLIGESPIVILMVTIGLANILGGVAGMIWGADTRAFPSIFSSSSIVWVSIGVCITLVVLFLIFFKFSILGIAMRAVASNQQAALSLGISVKKTLALTWGLSTVLSATAGIFLGNINGLTLNIKIYGLKALAPIILGGLESVGGAVVGGFLVGIFEMLGDGYLSDWVGDSVRDLVAFLIILLVLVIRPHGIFGVKEIERI